MSAEKVAEEVVEDIDKLAHMPIVYLVIGLIATLYLVVGYILTNSRNERTSMIDNSKRK